MRHKLEKPVSLAAIVDLLGKEVKTVSGSTEREILGIGSLPAPDPGCLAFCRHVDERLDAAVASQAAALIVPAERAVAASGPTLIAVDNPRLSFIRVAAWLYEEPVVPGIHPTAVIDPTSTVDPTAQVGPYVVIGPRCTVGPACILGAHVSLERDVRVGRHTKIDSGTKVGGEGFGFERTDTGELINFPHGGGVIIGDNVEIGANCCVDRGTLTDTVVGDGVRIDNLVQVAHNVKIGRHSVVICQTTLCGSVEIGKQAWISPGCQILNGAKIGDEAKIGMGSIVAKNVPAGEFWTGNPARKVPQH